MVGGHWKLCKKCDSSPCVCSMETETETEKPIRLLYELDAEMDGVTVPAPAAAILNSIREFLDQLEYFERTDP